MIEYPSHWPEVVEFYLQIAEESRSKSDDRSTDFKGVEMSMLASNIRFLGIAAYAIKGDRLEYRDGLVECASLQCTLFERHNAGEPISDSFVSMLSYKELLDALAAPSFDVAEKLAGFMGGRTKIEKVHDHPFDRTFGYALKHLVLKDADQIEASLSAFDVQCAKGAKAWAGYPRMLRAIHDRDPAAAQSALEQIVKGHKRLSSGSGVFTDTPDAVICVWAVGLANLARHRGVPVDGVDPNVPDDLLYRP